MKKSKLKQKTQGFGKIKNAVCRKSVEKKRLCYKHWSILADHTTTTERQNQACPGWKGQLLWGYWAAAVHIDSNRSNFAPGRFTKLEYFCSIFIRFSIHVVQVVPLCAAALLPSCMRVWKFPPRMPLLCSSSAGAKQLIVVVFLSSSFPLLRKSRAGEFLAGTFKRAGMAVIKRQDIKWWADHCKF